MKRNLCSFLFVAIFATALSSLAAERFVVETMRVVVRQQSSGHVVTNSEEQVFKLDSAIGSVWRLDTTNVFVLISAQDLVSQKGMTEQRMRDIRSRLKEIVIPIIDFQSASLSNVIVSLQEEIRQRDPSVRAGSKDFLRLMYRPKNSSDSKQLVSLRLKDISALDVLAYVCEFSGLEYVINEEDGSIDIIPFVAPYGAIVQRAYPVNPEFRDRLARTNVTNLFTEMGIKLYAGCSVTFIPEIDTIFLKHTFLGQQQFWHLLDETGMSKIDIGRYKLQTVSRAGADSLILLDTVTGWTWLYEATVMDGCKRREKFIRLWDNWQQQGIK